MTLPARQQAAAPPQGLPSGHAAIPPPICRENVLIFDMNNEYGEFLIPTIQIEHIEVFNQHPRRGIRRIVPFRPDPNNPAKIVKIKPTEMIALLSLVIETYKNGLLIIEDPSKFMGKNMTDDIVGAICTNRHSSCDVIMHYQNINRPLPVIHENTNVYRFHHQSTSVKKAKDKLEDAVEPLRICQILVDLQYKQSRDPRHPCKRKFVYWHKDINCIVGDFTIEMFNEALYTYIDENKTERKAYTDKQDRQTGALVYPTYQAAIEAFRLDLFNDYYGNDIIEEPLEREALFMVVTGSKGGGKTTETMRQTFEDYCGLPLPPIFHKMAEKMARYMLSAKSKQHLLPKTP